MGFTVSVVMISGHPAFNSRCLIVVDRCMSDVTLWCKTSTDLLACMKFCVVSFERTVYTIRQLVVEHVLAALSDDGV